MVWKSVLALDNGFILVEAPVIWVEILRIYFYRGTLKSCQHEPRDNPELTTP